MSVMSVLIDMDESKMIINAVAAALPDFPD